MAVKAKDGFQQKRVIILRKAIYFGKFEDICKYSPIVPDLETCLIVFFPFILALTY